MAVLHFLQVEWNKKIKLSLLVLFTSFGFSDSIALTKLMAFWSSRLWNGDNAYKWLTCPFLLDIPVLPFPLAPHQLSEFSFVSSLVPHKQLQSIWTLPRPFGIMCLHTALHVSLFVFASVAQLHIWHWSPEMAVYSCSYVNTQAGYT